jgi:hypothetical protein
MMELIEELLSKCWTREVRRLSEEQQKETRDFELTGHCRLGSFHGAA